MQVLSNLVSEDKHKLHTFIKTLREAGLNASLAYSGATILLQDESLGIEARTPEQQLIMSKISLIVGRY